MKKVTLLIILSVFISANTMAQKVYSEENLNKASDLELDSYLQKGYKLKKTGAILSISGPGLVLTGLFIAGYGYSNTNSDFLFIAGIIMMWTGAAATLVGIPILITGSTRVKNVKNAMDSSPQSVILKITPSILYNSQSNAYHPGIGLNFTF